MASVAATTQAKETVVRPTFYILFAISLGHFTNDMMQAVVPATFPILEKSLGLSYTQVGLIAFTLQMTSGLLQPVVGRVSDKRPNPMLLPLAMMTSGLGMITIAFAGNYWLVMFAALLIGLGSAIFHPEGSKVAYLASGTQRGLSQAIYQVGGNFGNALAPIFTIYLFLPFGQKGSLTLAVVAILGMCLMVWVSRWYNVSLERMASRKRQSDTKAEITPAIKKILGLIIFITFVRSWYGAGMGNYYQFYLIKDYGFPIETAQLYLFAFMFSGVVGTLLGGRLADRIGKKNLLVFSIVGSAPLALLLPYVGPSWVLLLLVLIGLILNSSFSVLVVYTQELMPGHVATVSGLIVGLAFGLGAIGAVALGTIADWRSLKVLMMLCSTLPLLALTSVFLPNDKKAA
ncbi:MAG: MFS transporter [Bacilli bacterium]